MSDAWEGGYGVSQEVIAEVELCLFCSTNDMGWAHHVLNNRYACALIFLLVFKPPPPAPTLRAATTLKENQKFFMYLHDYKGGPFRKK